MTFLFLCQIYNRNHSTTDLSEKLPWFNDEMTTLLECIKDEGLLSDAVCVENVKDLFSLINSSILSYAALLNDTLYDAQLPKLNAQIDRLLILYRTYLEQGCPDK